MNTTFNVKVFDVPKPPPSGRNVSAPPVILGPPKEARGFTLSARSGEHAKRAVEKHFKDLGREVRGVSFLEDGGIVAYVFSGSAKR